MNEYFARKALGQHFLTDGNVLQKIVNAIACDSQYHHIEIGPGLGALTRLILPKVPELTVIEYDTHIIPELEKNCAPLDNLHIVQKDVLKVDFAALAQEKPLYVFGNLPYNISTPILFHLLNYLPQIVEMCFMLQEEVVDRMVAEPNSKTYGRLSVMLQYYYTMEKLFRVAPSAFRPPPKVYSAVVRLIPKPDLPAAFNHQLFAEIVNRAFQQRRKTVHNSLKKLIMTETFISVGIDPNARAENLSVADFVRLTWSLTQLT